MTGLPALGQITYPAPDDIRDSLLRTTSLAYARRGVTLNTKPGSDAFITATALSDVVTIAYSNAQLTTNNLSPLTAAGAPLQQLCQVWGVPSRPASSGAGNVIVRTAGGGTTAIPNQYQATAPNGDKYQVVGSQIVTNGSSVPVVAVDTGSGTNQAPGTVLSWDSASVGALLSTCTVDSAGITGGADGDTDETLRARLLQRLANPGAGGNWPQVVSIATLASAAIAGVFVYPAVRGPGSYDIAIIGTPANGLVLGASTIQAVASAVQGQLPGYTSINVTSVALQPLDLVVDLRLPLPQTAGGNGGGWVDNIPWPATPDIIIAAGPATGSTFTVQTIDSSTMVNTPAGGTNISVWDPVGQAFNNFAVTSATSVSPWAWSITVAPLDSSSSVAVVGARSFISPFATNIAAYGKTLLAKMQALGPGEKTSNPYLIPRALRHPSVDITAPTDASSVLLAAISDAAAEVLDISYGARFATGTTTTLTTPSLPNTTADAPNVLTLQNLAFRRV